MKVLVVGNARHGKDTVCEILRDEFGLTFISSSLFCAEIVCRPYMKEVFGKEYETIEACFEDRVNYRAGWYTAIQDFNRPDKARLAKMMLEKCQVYSGMRDWRELNACKNERVFDVIVWVDRSMVLPPEDAGSMTIKQWMSDFTIDNNGTLEDLRRNVQILFTRLLRDHNMKQIGAFLGW